MISSGSEAVIMKSSRGRKAFQSGEELDLVRRSCLEFIESLWRDSGGFAGHVADEIEDGEYTFYALLSIGCLTAKQRILFPLF